MPTFQLSCEPSVLLRVKKSHLFAVLPGCFVSLFVFSCYKGSSDTTDLCAS